MGLRDGECFGGGIACGGDGGACDADAVGGDSADADVYSGGECCGGDVECEYYGGVGGVDAYSDAGAHGGGALGVDVTTYHNDNARDGLNASETILTPANVSSATFGKLNLLSVDGLVDAEPLYLSAVTIGGQTHNVLYVVTEHDSVYAFDADSGAQLWKVSALGSGETTSDNHGCGQITPEIGITSTPVIDRTKGANGEIFVGGDVKGQRSGGITSGCMRWM